MLCVLRQAYDFPLLPIMVSIIL